MLFCVYFFLNDTSTTEIYTDTLFPYTTLFRSREHAGDPSRRVHRLRRLRAGMPARGHRARHRSPGQSLAGAEPGLFRQQLAEHRSEEHTSELQSLMRISYAVFCLKKKNT